MSIMNYTKNWLLAIGLTLAPIAAVQAQTANEDGQTQTAKRGSWVKRNIKALGKWLDDWAIEGVDTNYLALPRYGWKASVTANFAGIGTKVEGHNIPTYNSIDIDMRSNLSGQTTVSLGYRGLSWDYSFDVANGYSSDMSLSWLDNAFGIEYRSHSTDGLHGTLDASATPESLPVSKGDTRLKATIINGYYVFNSKRYSLPAAMEQSLIQKRSAGSLTAYALFMTANLEAKNATLGQMLGGLKRIEFYQAALGLGYGYNYTPNQGRLLMHLSAAPLLVLYNKNFITADYAIPLPDGTAYHTDISKEVKSEHRYFLTGVARASVFYTLSPRVHFGVSALVNNIHFSTDSGVKLSMNDWIANATVGVRF